MQSDERVAAALSALRPQIALFRFAISGTLDRARKTLDAEAGPSRTGVALGDFACGRIDPQRFAMVFAGSAPLDMYARAVVKRAAEVLESLLRAGDEQFVVDVQPGESAAEAIRERLATLGSAFGASALLELVRRHTYNPPRHGLPFEGYQFEKWTTGERKLAPPLVIRIDGRDLDAFELAPLIDGGVRFILLVAEPCAPAPLARLISPDVFVAQAEDIKVLDKVAEFNGSAVVALMKGAEARFVHDPRAGSAMWQRIDVTRMPAVLPRKTLGVRSASQQRDDLAHLRALIEPPVLLENPAALVAATGGDNTDATERLTAWLLDQFSRAGVA